MLISIISYFKVTIGKKIGKTIYLYLYMYL